jgi:glycosyltransferase involved in cell wall biosynthesis
MTKPLVDIIVRTKDRPLFLDRAIRSILGQSFADWRAIIVNDGGDANAVQALVAGYPELGGRVTLIHHAQSLGRWPAANAGVNAGSAPLVVLHDDDDSWHPDFLSAGVAHLDAHPTAEGGVARIEIRWEERKGAGFETIRTEVFQPHLAAPMLTDLMLFNRFVPIAFLYRRTLHDAVGMYDESLPVVGDWVFNMRVLQRGPVDYFGLEPLAYWHQRPNATGTDGNSVIAESAQHGRWDGRLRESALREYIDEAGPGLPLYLTKFIDDRFVQVENGIRDEIRAPFEARDNTRIRRWARRLRLID